MNNIFFDTSKISITNKKQLLEDVKSICYCWWVDVLDCSKSFYRIKIEMSWEDILNKLTDKCHFTIVLRQSSQSDYYEISFCTLNSTNDYFLWVLVAPEKIYSVLEKYNIKPIKTYEIGLV